MRANTHRAMPKQRRKAPFHRIAQTPGTRWQPQAALRRYDEAKSKAAEAAKYAENAKSMFATADQMNQDIPKYQGAAQAAAAKAAFDSMPACAGALGSVVLDRQDI